MMTETNSQTTSHDIRVNRPHRRNWYFAVGILVALILTAGITASAAQVAAQTAPAAPTNFTAEPSGLEGEIRLAWDAVEGVTRYRVCFSPNPPKR